MGRRIFINNLPFSIEEDALESALQEVLSAFGTVMSLRLIFEGSTLRPQGLCFAEMASAQEAQAAIDALDGMMVAGHRLEVASALPRLCVPESKPASKKNERKSSRGNPKRTGNPPA